MNYWHATAAALALAAPAQDIDCDVAIIGAGYTGLNAALELARSGQRVVVFDEAPGWGASGRSGGFCCVGGGVLEEASMRRRYGASAAQKWTAWQRRAVQHVAHVLEREHIDADCFGLGELCIARSPRQAIASNLSAAQLRQYAMHIKGAQGAHYEPIGFGLHPQRYVNGLVEAVQRAGGRLFSARVEQVIPGSQAIRLRAGGAQCHAQQLLIACNAYAPEALVPQLAGRVCPAVSSIFVTEPIAPWQEDVPRFCAMAYDARSVLHYFRPLPDGRVLFGGRGGLSESSDAMYCALRQRFDDYFPQWRDVRTQFQWQGSIALTRRGLPFIGELAPGIWSAFGYHGNGIAAGSLAGTELARLILGKAGSIPSPLSTLPKAFVLASWRRAYLAALYAVLRPIDAWRDR